MGKLSIPLKEQSDLVVGAWLSAFKPPEKMTVTDFAEKNIILTDSAIPGRYRTSNAPYQREMQDSFSDPKVRKIVLMMSAQVGKTNSLVNMLSYMIAQCPDNGLIVAPTLELAEAIIAEKVEPVIDASPLLQELTCGRRDKGGHRSKRKIQYEGGVLSVSGTKNASNLRMRSTRYLLCDEVDEFAFEIKGQGDPLELAVKRTVTFPTAKIVLASTPTLKGFSRIEREFEETDQRVWEAKCVHCNEFNEIVFDDIDLEAKCWHCPECGAQSNEGQRIAAVKAGRWRATATSVSSDVVGFRINELSSTFSSLDKIVRAAKDAEKDPLKWQAFTNTTLGQPYDPELDLPVTPEILKERAIEIDPEAVPMDAGLITASCDVQIDRLEVQYIAWGENDCWVLDHVKLEGDPSGPKVWKNLEETFLREFDCGRGHSMTPEVCMVDSGNWTQTVYSFCNDNYMRGRQWFPLKGVSGPKVIIDQSKQVVKGNLKLQLVGTDTCKDMIFGRLSSMEPDHPKIYFPDHLLTTDFFDQVCAEKRVETRNAYGHKTTKYQNPKRKRNEALDCLVYNLAARNWQRFEMKRRVHERQLIASGLQDTHRDKSRNLSMAELGKLSRNLGAKKYA